MRNLRIYSLNNLHIQQILSVSYINHVVHYIPVGFPGGSVVKRIHLLIQEIWA